MTGKELDKCIKHFDMFQGTLHEEKIKKNFALFCCGSEKKDIIKYEDIDFVMTHVTTSDNQCKDILEKGIQANHEVYKNVNSQLRRYLDKYGVSINFEEQSILCKGKSFFYKDEQNDEDEEISKALNQLFYDFSVCGFKSVNEVQYTCLKNRPELIDKISNQFNLNMSSEWTKQSKPYMISALVKNVDIFCGSFFEKTIEELLYEAYKQANRESSKRIILKDNINVSIDDIIELKPLSFW